MEKTKEVVINVCFGGFGLSLLAQEMFLKLKGKTAYFYKQTKYKFNDGVNEWIKIDSNEDGLFVNTILCDLGKSANELPHGKDEYFSDIDIERDDQDLIKVIKELGEKADNRCSKLKIIKIPANIEYTIEEYDGLEHIAEKHRTWN